MDAALSKQCLHLALDIARQAGEMIRPGFHAAKAVEEKDGPRDLVTATDKAVEAMAVARIREAFPQHKIIGEEGTAAEQSKVTLTQDPTWIIDPIDGTMNFVHSFPYTCISIGVWAGGEGQVGVIYNPILEETYTATKGEGAFLNGKQIKVSGKTELSQSLVMMEMWERPDPVKMAIARDNFKALSTQSHGPRSMGSAALNMAMVARGGAEVYCEIGIHAWDMAAGAVLVREAGGVVMDMSGGELDLLNRRVLCASSAELAKTVLAKVKVYEEARD